MEHFIEGVIFDFNGTLYCDDDLNDRAWRETIIAMTGPGYDYDDLVNQTRALKNSLLIQRVHEIIGKDISKEKIQEWSEYKEVVYRKLCTDLKRNQLAKGAEELLNYLKEQGIPVNLCTNSIASNVQYYFNNVKLSRWFDIEKTVYDTGEYANKVMMYQVAAKRIGTTIDKCVVFEDTPNSIKEAINAGCKKVFALQDKEHGSYKEIVKELRDFTELDYELLDLKKQQV